MKKFWKRFLAILGFGVAVLSLSACQSSNRAESTIDTNGSYCSLTYEADGTPHCIATICIKNNTIYNVKNYSITAVVIDEHKTELEPVTFVTEWGCAHGFSGYVTFAPFRLENPAYKNATGVKIIDASPCSFQDVWETYMPWWIITITVFSIATLFYAFELFGAHHSKEEIIESFKGHMATMLVSMLIVFLICFIPLMFSSWVVSVILLGGFGAFAVVSGLLSFCKIKLGRV